MATETITMADLGGFFQSLVADLSREKRATVLRTIGQMAVTETKLRFVQGVDPGGQPWKPLKRPRLSGGQGKPLRDTGLLAASISSRQVPEGVEVGTNVDYAAIHQYGGVLRPTRGKYLAIPTTREAQRAGGPRRFPRELRFIPKDGETALLVEEVDGKNVVQFVLKTEIEIPRRAFLGFSRQLLQDAQRMIADAYLEQIAES